MSAFVWTSKTEDAAEMVAAGELTFAAIARSIDTSVITLRKWREHEDFAARVAEIRDEYRAHVRGRGLAAVEKRVDAYHDRWRRMQGVIEARAADPELTKVPGGATGLITCRDWRQVGRGEDAEMMAVYEVDTGLLREIRELEKQAAQDLGQWASKTELTGAGGSSLTAALEATIAQVYGLGEEKGSGTGGADPE